MTLYDDIKRLNEQQLAIVKKFNKTSLIVAGPGTGKTRTVSVLIGNLLQSGYKLKDILALTFSEKAASELRTRVLEYFPNSFDQCWISTFHSFCARILREHYYLLAIKNDFRLMTGFKEALLMSGICKKADPNIFPEFGKVINRRGFQQEVLTFISLLKSNIVEPKDFEYILTSCLDLSQRTKNRLNELLYLFKLYEKERIQTGFLDFRDLISLSIKVLQDADSARLYRQKFKVILVDEFQDTDPAQFLLLSLLKGDSDSIKTAVIGDPRQSIYRFRGADPSMMTSSGAFKKKYKAKVFSLDLNYRSAKSIIDTATKLNWQQKSELDGRFKACSKEEGFVKLYKTRDELEEARLLGRKIASLLVYGEKRIYKPEEIAILVRNNYQIDLISECLRALHIDFSISGDMKFFKSEEVIALATLLKVAATTGTEQDEALKRAFASPVFAMKPLWIQAILANLSPSFTIRDIFAKISKNELEGIPEVDEETLLKAVAFIEMINIIENCAEGLLSVVFARLILSVSHLLKDPSMPQARNILHFRGMIADYCEVFVAQYGRSPNVTDLMPEFDEWLAYYASTLEQNSDIDEKGVKIMTIHQSKGLEFPVVVVCGLCEGQFPVDLRENLLLNSATIEFLRQQFNKNTDRSVSFFNPYPLTHEEHLEEERRLFFVAITRAKEGLVLSYPMRMGTDPTMPSIFLREIGLNPETIEAEERPLTTSEFRIKMSHLSSEQLEHFEPVLTEFENSISKDISIHGIRPRNFEIAKIDEVSIPDNFAFSASSLTNYIDCPRRFFFLNIMKIRDPIQVRQPHFIVGNAFHACLEKLHEPTGIWEQGKLPDSNDLQKLIEENALPLLSSLEFFQQHIEIENLKKALPVYVDSLFKLEQLPPRGTIGVESRFDIKIHGRRFIGRFDRLVRLDDNSVLVIDYKSGSSTRNSDKVFNESFPECGSLREIQLPLYLLASQQLKFKNVATVLLHVKQEAYKKNYGDMQAGFLRSASLNLGCGPNYGVKVSQDNLDRFSKSLKNLLEEIYNQKTFDCRPSIDVSARSCKVFDISHQPKCEFFSFCRERLEQLKMDNHSE